MWKVYIMKYLDGALDPKLAKNLIAKIKEGSKGLDIQPLRGHSHFFKARVNIHDRIFFKLDEKTQEPQLLAYLSHQKQDRILKNQQYLNVYLRSIGVKDLKLEDVKQFDAAFDNFQNESDRQHVEKQLLDNCGNQLTPLRWTGTHLIKLDDIQEAAIDIFRSHLIHGIPGSGKTTDLQELCKEACKQQLLSQGEIKEGEEQRHIFLTPNFKLAEKIATAGLAFELSEYRFLCVQDLKTFAKAIDPVIAMLELESKEEIEKNTLITARRSVDDFIVWCQMQNIPVEQPKNQDKKKSLEAEDYYILLYQECNTIACCETKKAYTHDLPSQRSFFKKDVKAREKRFDIYAKYCTEELMGSHIPKDTEEVLSDTIMPSAAYQRAQALGKRLGYDLNFYDLLPALRKQNIHTLYLDEVHNYPKLFLSAVLSLGCKIQAAGDSDQGLYDILLPLEHLRQIFNFRAKAEPEAFKVHAFMTSYRASQAVAKLLTEWLRFQYTCCPSTDPFASKEVQIPPNTIRGSVNYFKGFNSETGNLELEVIEKYKLLCANNPNMAFVTASDEEAEVLQKALDTPLVLTADEICGLEYTHLVIVGDILKKVKSILEKRPKLKANTQKSTRPKNKEESVPGEELVLELHKIYVILSRAVESLDIDKCNDLEQLLDLKVRDNLCIQEMTVQEEQKYEVESTTLRSAEQNHIDWITRCNEFIQQALSEGLHKKKKISFLQKAKKIFENENLKASDIQLSPDVKLPEGFECFLPSKPESLVKALVTPKLSVDIKEQYLLFIKTVLQDFSLKNVKNLFNKKDVVFEKLLFLPFADENEHPTTLWNSIFNDEDKTKLFLITAVNPQNPEYERKLQLILDEKGLEETRNSVHYCRMVCMSKLWLFKKEPEFQKINQIVKELIFSVTLKDQKVVGRISDESYYAMAQRALMIESIKNNETKKAECIIKALSPTALNRIDENELSFLDRAVTWNREEIVDQLLPHIDNLKILFNALRIAVANNYRSIEGKIKERHLAIADNKSLSTDPSARYSEVNFIRRMLEDLSPSNVENLLGNKGFLFISFEDTDGILINAWDSIFSHPKKAETFLVIAVQTVERNAKLRDIVFDEALTPEKTQESSHYYMLLLLTHLWIKEQKPEHKSINQITKQLILRVTQIQDYGMSEALYYAIAARELIIHLSKKISSGENDQKTYRQIEHLDNVSKFVLYKQFLEAITRSEVQIVSMLTQKKYYAVIQDVMRDKQMGPADLTLAATLGDAAIVKILLNLSDFKQIKAALEIPDSNYSPLMREMMQLRLETLGALENALAPESPVPIKTIQPILPSSNPARRESITEYKAKKSLERQ